MGNQNKRALRNAKKRERQRLIEKEKASSEREQSKEEIASAPSLVSPTLVTNLPASATGKQTHGFADHRNYREGIMRPLIAIWHFARRGGALCDRHAGSITALATVAIVILTSFYARYSKKQWETMLDSNRTTSKSLQVSMDTLLTSHRPWVYVVDNAIGTTQPVSFDSKGGAHAEISYSVKNTGNSPALNVAVIPTMRIGSVNMMMKEDSPCDNDKLLAQLTNNLGGLIVPGQSMVTKGESVTGTWYFPKSLSMLAEPKTYPISVWLELCIPYRDEFAKVHATKTHWMYLSSDHKQEFMAEGAIQGQWQSFGVGDAAY